MSFLLLPPFSGKPIGSGKPILPFKWRVRVKRVRLFLTQQWATLLWSLFVALLAGIAFRDFSVWLFLNGCFVAFHWRLWRETSALRSRVDAAERALKRSYMANRVLSGAVESSAEYIVEQRMAMEGNPLGPVVWIDGRAFPIDDEGVANYTDDQEV